MEITRCRLDAAGFADSNRWVEHGRINAHLRTATTAEAVQWADKIKSVAALPLECLDLDLLSEGERTPVQTGRTADHDLRAQMVVAAFSDWRDHLLTWHKHNRDARMLCFLVASAVLEGRSVVEIHGQLESLHSALVGRKTSLKNVGLNGPGIIELVDIIGARTTRDLRVEFTRPGYGDAVLDYFWVDRQPVQEEFLHWMCALPMTLGEDETADRVTQRIAAYALRWTLRNGKFTIIQKIAESWGADRRYRDTVVNLITAAALDPSFGRTARQKLLEWSKPSGGYSAELRSVVADVCAGPLSRVYLSLSITRLGYLAKSDSPVVIEAVGNAMRTLWFDDVARTEVQKTLERWLGSESPAQRNAVQHTFLTLAGLLDSTRGVPVLMDALAGADRNVLLVNGWRAVLEDPNQRVKARNVLSLWLDATFSDSTFTESFTRMLIGAATQDSGEHYNAQPSLTAIFSVYQWVDQSPIGDSEMRRSFGDELIKLIRSRDPLGSTSPPMPGVPPRSVDASPVA
ncbi:hypothetical protein [Polymorphospora sp. NPDC050346]|uniref:hypothetical protein n=1 Tax=Polymorphospora sp. NPDC050346 TaxID=3155780 RepID=UPI003409C5D8